MGPGQEACLWEKMSCLSDLEEMRRMHLKCYLAVTQSMRRLMRGVPAVDDWEVDIRVQAWYRSQPPRAVLLCIRGDLPPSLNAYLKFDSSVDREIWRLMKGWWHTAVAKAFGGRRFGYAPLERPGVVVAVLGPKSRDLDNYGAKSLLDALEDAGVVRTDGEVKWLLQMRLSGTPGADVLVTEQPRHLFRWALALRRQMARLSGFDPLMPDDTKTGSMGDDFYAEEPDLSPQKLLD
ncbi:MAG: hypothetical protein ACPLPR_01340 [Bacillota bacterium]